MKYFIVNTAILSLIVIIGSVLEHLFPGAKGAIVGGMVAASFIFGEIRGESK